MNGQTTVNKIFAIYYYYVIFKLVYTFNQLKIGWANPHLAHPDPTPPVVGTICVQTVLAFFILGKRDAFELRLSHVPMYLFLPFFKEQSCPIHRQFKKKRISKWFIDNTRCQNICCDGVMI